MMESERPIGVLGAGPVGSILAACFARTGQKVVVVEAVEERRQQVQQGGLNVVGTDTVSSRAHAVLGSIEELAPHDLQALFICTKTWALKSILPPLAKTLRPDTLVVSFQNGIGPEDEVAAFIPRANVARGIVNYAGNVDSKTGTVTMQWFNPPNVMGPLDAGTTPRLEHLCSVLSRSGLATETISEMEMRKQVFFKTILNSALSALCASSGITMREAMTFRNTRTMARLLLREGLSVAAAVGYTYGENAKEVCMRYLDAGGDHLPSMWWDLKSRRPTEIEYINGKIVKIGLTFKHINVDANIFFTSAIVTQEIKAGVRSPDDVPDYLAQR